VSRARWIVGCAEAHRQLRSTAADEPEPGGSPAYDVVTDGFVMEAVTRRAVCRSLREVQQSEIEEPLGLK